MMIIKLSNQAIPKVIKKFLNVSKVVIGKFVILLFMTINPAWSGGDDFFTSGSSKTSGFGNAVETNKALQTVDPWPVHSKNTHIQYDGTRILNALGNLESRSVSAQSKKAPSTTTATEAPSGTETTN